MKRRMNLLVSGLCVLASSCALVAAQEDASYFRDTIKPLLEKHCNACHREDPDDLGGALALSSKKNLLQGGDSGPAIDLGNIDASLLLKALSYEDDSYQMPPEGKLAAEEIAAFRKWIEMGLPWDKDDEAEIHSEPAEGPPQVNEQNKKWWSFQKVQRPPVPDVQDKQWPLNEIDNFVLADLERADLKPAPAASRSDLFRRAWYDLVGLPPSPEQARAFANQTDAESFEQLVDELLDSKHYGEKWGRHWLDLVAWAESNSFERDATKPFAWRYRDYVIDSFNSDKPYDRFLIEQLAGDELESVTPETMAATGFYRLGAWDDEPADRKLARYDELSHTVTVVGQSMMGLTVDCARCHDHKIDPIPQKDFYQMVSFFENIRSYGKRDHNSVLAASVTQMDERKVEPAQREAHKAKIANVDEELGAIEEIVKEDFESVEHEEFKHIANRQRLLKKRIGKLIDQKQFDQYVQLHNKRRHLEEHPPQGILKILCVKEKGNQPPKSFIQIRGNPHVQGEEVQPGFLSVLSPPEPDIQPPANGKSSGRRMAFAKWLTGKDHPLTARVIANRVWQYHFGRGIVRTSSDFGFQGSPPTHPELLDWLASELVENNWSLKHLHRKIMLSRTWQMSTKFNADAFAADPENDRFWRFNPRRLTAEEIRDSVLAVSGQLELSKIGGRSIYPALPKEVLEGQSMPGNGWQRSNDKDARRRSVYIHVKRTMGFPLLESNDAATTDSPCPVRFVTTQPTQALGLINSEFTNRQAQLLADSIGKQHADRRDQVRAVLEKVFQRQPTATEIDRGIELIENPTLGEKGSTKDPFEVFCLMALNLNEFFYLQ